MGDEDEGHGVQGDEGLSAENVQYDAQEDEEVGVGVEDVEHYVLEDGEDVLLGEDVHHDEQVEEGLGVKHVLHELLVDEEQDVDVESVQYHVGVVEDGLDDEEEHMDHGGGCDEASWPPDDVL